MKHFSKIFRKALKPFGAPPKKKKTPPSRQKKRASRRSGTPRLATAPKLASASRQVEERRQKFAALLNLDPQALTIVLDQGSQQSSEDLYLAEMTNPTCRIRLIFTPDLLQVNLVLLIPEEHFYIEDLFALLATHNLNDCDEQILREAVESLVAVRSDKRCNFCISKGTPPTPGRDAEINFMVPYKPKPGKLNENGSINFKEISSELNVEEGTLLATYAPASQGLEGQDVTGRKIPPSPVDEKTLKAGENVEITEEDGICYFRASIEGRVSLTEDVLEVRPVLTTNSDVSYETGNIDFPGDVFIAGSVLNGFSVTAGGAISVQGQVEAGSKLEAKGSILVGGGIVGSDTKVVSKQTITTRFIQDATVHSGSDVDVFSHVFNATIRCLGMVNVRRGTGTRSGAIAGGQILAARGIRASYAGSPNGTLTELVAGIDPFIEEALHKCQRDLISCQKNMDRVHRQLGLEKITPPLIKSLLKRVGPKKRLQVSHNLRQWVQLQKRTKGIRTRRNDLRKNLAGPALEAVLAVEQTIYPGVKLRLGEREAKVQEHLQGRTLTLATWSTQLVLQPAA